MARLLQYMLDKVYASQSRIMKAKKRKERKGKLKPKKKRKQNFLMFDILKISQRILIELLIHQNISFVVV
jgi:hypothetical protein